MISKFRTLLNTQVNFNYKYKYLSLVFILILSLLIPSLSHAEEWIYTTRPDDTLWDISKKYLKKVSYWERLQKHNTVDIAKHLSPGTKLRIPLEWLKVVAAPALVVSVTGEAHLKASDDSQLKTLSSKQLVNIGDTVSTGDNGSALIQFADGSNLLVQKNSQVIFNTLSVYGETGMVDTQLRLQKGRVETAVKPLRGSFSRYEITTPAAVAAVRGTKFRVAYTNNNEIMASEVVKGNISVAAEGTEQSLNKGFGSITEKGNAPQPPVQLLSKPDLTGLPIKVRRLPFVFQWPTLNDAEQYRIQISPAKHADTLSLEMLTNIAEYSLNTLQDGQYILRVRGLDKNSLEGFNAEHHFEINTDFPVVTLINPVNKSEFSNEELSFEWSKEQNAVNYHLQIATDIHFNNLIFDEISSNNTIKLKEKLPENTYFWRVIAIDSEGYEGKASTTEQFSVHDDSYEALLILLYLFPAFLI